ncbi:hypothetical protein [Streptomyces sp. NPDC005805]|uniref:hypothetical protein n=1 Tax=Streptomyces sp. NPDC005805 TaxID=3157068 RepID=UPI0033D5F007
MHGPGFAPPQPRRPSTALLVVVRVVLVALALVSFGFLAWGALLRLAAVRRRPLDWVLFTLSLVLAVVAVAMIGAFGAPADANPNAVDFVFIFLMLGLAVGGSVHYLIAEIRHYQAPPAVAGWAGPAPTGSPYGPTIPTPGPFTARTPGYGYPAPPRQTPPPQRHTPPPQHTPPPGTTPHPGSGIPGPAHIPAGPGTPQPGTPGTGPGPERPKARIDQVRAELDELSDLLRGGDQPGGGGRDGGPGDRNGDRDGGR